MPREEDAPATGRRETPEQRADRRWNETLQEVRVTQTGAQILFAFLLGVAFSGRFPELSTFDRNLYVASILLAALANGTLVAPVAFHLFAAGRGLKPQLVRAAMRMTVIGITLLALTVATALLLLLRVSIGGVAAWILTGIVMLWFAVCWIWLPRAVVRVGARRPGGKDPEN